MTKDELKKLLGDEVWFPDDDSIGDLPYFKLKPDNHILGWGANIGSPGSCELTDVLDKTIAQHVRSAVILALASLSVIVDEKGVCVYGQVDKEDILLVPWKALLADPDFNRHEEWREDIVKAIETASRYNKKKEDAK